jgi:hypothetical protein
LIKYNKPQAYYFKVQLDGKEHLYGMLFLSVLFYADSDQPGFMQFHLPDQCPGNPDSEMVQIGVP